jgi:sporulation-control protein spo0M
MAIKRYPLTKELLDDARTDRDASKESQFAVESPRGLSVRIRGGEVAYYVRYPNLKLRCRFHISGDSSASSGSSNGP